ncbi:uncharacterized protein LOC134831040 [Culicoides brevitarsis]|uniref:uncharacterized protein LOC134831040 n=1 Tax=Culicoides brevitarsis TaxID=469753 RepID=UPI00307C5D84
MDLDFSSKYSDRSQAEFNPYRCGTCGRVNSSLKTCSGCRLISFCSVDCQKKYWKVHKPLCKAVSKILTSRGKATIFDVQRLELEDDMTDKEKFAMSYWQLMFKMREYLGRNLDFEERLLFTFPKYCEVCYETDPFKLKTCSGCKNSSFCKTGDCQMKAEADPNIHEKYCPEKKLAFMCRRDFKFKEIFKSLPETMDFGEFLANNPECNLFTLIEKVADKKFVRRPENIKQMESYSTVCQFNFTATIIYALHKARLLHPDREMLKIHLVGVQNEISQFCKETMGLFFVFLPHLQSIKLALIGPEMDVPGVGKQEIDFFGRSVEISYHPMFYEDFSGDKPDLIMCLNSGFNDYSWGKTPVPHMKRHYVVFPGTPDTDWVRGMKKILKQKVPFAFTTFIAAEIYDDAWFVKRVAEKMNVYRDLVGVEIGKNPFQDLKPFLHTDFLTDEKLLYANQRICVMNWKENIGEEFVELKKEFEKILLSN